MTKRIAEELLSIGGGEIRQKLDLIPEPLVEWYRKSARILPWRSNPTPYRVWLSEIMLQQTRVEAVIPYYLRFLEALPDIPSLANAEEEQLHKLWEGLGYYSRVRNLHKAAVQVMERYDGMLPPSYELLLDLCGVGEYTAGAIASIAFGVPVPAVDGNVLRVLSRLTASEADVSRSQVKSAYRTLLCEIIPPEQPGDFNQAMMELGATVCLPNGMPKCAGCPLQFCCDGYQQGNPLLYPVKGEKKPRRIQEKTVFLLCSSDRVLLSRRPDTGLLAGLWEFPNPDGKLTKTEATEWLKQQGVQFTKLTPINRAKHIFTHVEWRMRGFLVECDFLPLKRGQVLAARTELEEAYAIPNAFLAYKKRWLEWHQAHFEKEKNG